MFLRNKLRLLEYALRSPWAVPDTCCLSNVRVVRTTVLRNRQSKEVLLERREEVLPFANLSDKGRFVLRLTVGPYLEIVPSSFPFKSLYFVSSRVSSGDLPENVATYKIIAPLTPASHTHNPDLRGTVPEIQTLISHHHCRTYFSGHRRTVRSVLRFSFACGPRPRSLQPSTHFGNPSLCTLKLPSSTT